MKNKIIKIALTVLPLIWGCSNADDANKIEASGSIESTNVTLSAKVPGEIISLKFSEGDNIRQGDTLMIIDHENLQIQLKQASAGVDMAKAQLSLLQNGARKEDIKQVEESLKQAEINLTQAQKDKDRAEKLLESNTFTRKQYEDAEARWDMAAAQLNSVRENLKKIKNIARPEEILQAKANLDKAQAALDLLNKNIKDTYVLSPTNGVIVKKYFEAGESVSMSSSLCKISDLTKVNLVIYVSEEELGKVKLGQKVDVSVDAYKNKVYNGKVTFISPEAEFTPKNIQTKDERTKLVFAVKIEIKNPSFELKAGMPADAVINLK